jgi:hypothetical protein
VEAAPGLVDQFNRHQTSRGGFAKGSFALQCRGGLAATRPPSSGPRRATISSRRAASDTRLP